MNDAQLEELLHEEESSTLDFKRDQYPFAGATDEEKSELLKDILAFANAWRRTTAFILVGVEEVKGGRSRPVGVTRHLNDNDLQQFVNSKTNRPVSFAYAAYDLGGEQIGIFEIPVQSRPVYLKKPFGKLAPSTVYLRRGSSTDTAQLDELVSMGAADALTAANGLARPSVELEWAGISRQASLGPSVELASHVLAPRLSPDELRPRAAGPFALPVIPIPIAPGYYEDLVEFIYDSQLFSRVGFVLRNSSGAAAENVVLKGRVEKQEAVRITDYRDAPVAPSKYSHLSALSHVRSLAEQMLQRPDPLVEEYVTHWEITVPFGVVLPRATVFSTDTIYIGATRPSTVTLNVEVYAANLPVPSTFALTAKISADSRPMTRADLPRAALED